MDITTEHIGAILRRHDTGERFQVTDVSDTGISILSEDGSRNQLTSHTANGEVVHDEEQINRFQQNLKLAQCLAAAEQAALRRQSHPDSPAAEEAFRVSQIIEEQRQTLSGQLNTERSVCQSVSTHSFDDILNSARERAANQRQEQSIQSKKLTR